MNKLFYQSSKEEPSRVSYDYELNDHEFNVSFEIDYLAQKKCIDENFSKIEPWKNWELWKSDVVEIFFQTDYSKEAYYEIQVSPLNQGFQLYIIEPRKIFLTPLETLYRSEVTHQENIVKFNIKFDMNSIKGTPIRFGFFAILNHKHHYAHYKFTEDEKIDFHKPEKFI